MTPIEKMRNLTTVRQQTRLIYEFLFWPIILKQSTLKSIAGNVNTRVIDHLPPLLESFMVFALYDRIARLASTTVMDTVAPYAQWAAKYVLRSSSEGLVSQYQAVREQGLSSSIVSRTLVNATVAATSFGVMSLFSARNVVRENFPDQVLATDVIIHEPSIRILKSIHRGLVSLALTAALAFTFGLIVNWIMRKAMDCVFAMDNPIHTQLSNYLLLKLVFDGVQLLLGSLTVIYPLKKLNDLRTAPGGVVQGTLTWMLEEALPVLQEVPRPN